MRKRVFGSIFLTSLVTLLLTTGLLLLAVHAGLTNDMRQRLVTESSYLSAVDNIGEKLEKFGSVYADRLTLVAQDGTVLSAVDSRWILVDTRTKRILRRPPEDMPMPFVQPPVCELDVSLVKGEAQPVAEETAFYTRCDQNRHMNNTYYADIVCDHVPLERIAAHAPARLAVVYHSEVPMGASFTLLRAQTGENGWYFVGTDGEKKHFEANLTLTE